MQQNNPEADALLKVIQQREKDQLQQLNLCSALSQVTDRKGFTPVLQSLKEIIGFEAFVIGVTDTHEKEYTIFFHNNDKAQSELLGVRHQVEDGYFNAALQSAEPIVYNINNLKLGKNGLPIFMQREQQLAVREVVALPLQYHKNNPSVLFLFFKNANSFSNITHRLIKGISMQLALTVSNCLITEKIVMSGNTTTSSQLPSQDTEAVTISKNDYSDIIGQGKTMQSVINLVKQVAPSDSGVLLLGETGVGKEVIAHAIHKNSACRNKKMVQVNCAAIPANLIESELFGHEKGSFTGAVQRRIGKFENAHNSTLFLDEIGELPLAMQTKLLRVLQEMEFERIGSAKTIKVNVRIIAATNLNLQKEVAEGRFRADLFYRLNIFPILVPPLRDRKQDIAELSTHFVSEFCLKAKRKTITLSAKVLEAMVIYSWPGNVRELKHVLERSVLLTRGTIITEIKLPEIITDSIDNQVLHRIKPLNEIEKDHILDVIRLCNGRISGPNGAAKKLGIPNTTLISKMQKLGITKAHTVKQEK